MKHEDFMARPIPRAAFAGAIALVGATLLMTGAIASGLIEKPKTASAQRVTTHVALLASRDLRFADRADGALLISERGRVTHIIAPGDPSGFIRGVLRGLARDRKMRGIGQEPPFRLSQWANGTLSLTDTATDRTIELGSFGDTNRAAFARLLRS